jgi:hypothetical protein
MLLGWGLLLWCSGFAMASEKAAELAECAESLTEPANSLRDIGKSIAGTATASSVLLRLLLLSCLGLLARLARWLAGLSTGRASPWRLARWAGDSGLPLGLAELLRRDSLRSGHLCG